MTRRQELAVLLMDFVVLLAIIGFIGVCVVSYQAKTPVGADPGAMLFTGGSLFACLVVVVVMEIGKAQIEAAANTAKMVRLLEELAEAQRKRVI